jgi:hypothetical protein
VDGVELQELEFSGFTPLEDSADTPDVFGETALLASLAPELADSMGGRGVVDAS